MLRLRISRRLLRGVGIALAVLAFLGVCYVLGDRLTPRDRAGRPLVLSPSVYAAERYRRAVVEWIADLDEVDRGLTALLAEGEVTDPTRLYALGQAAEELVDRATRVAEDAAFTPAPPALVGLSERVRTAAQAHLEAALATARWVGAPEPENRYAALEALRTARALRLALEEDPWVGGLDTGGQAWYAQSAGQPNTEICLVRRPDSLSRPGLLGPRGSGLLGFRSPCDPMPTGRNARRS